MDDKTTMDKWINPDEWVSRYGEVISKSHAAQLIDKSPAHITALLHNGSLREYRHGISVRQLAELQFAKRINAVKNSVAINTKNKSREGK